MTSHNIERFRRRLLGLQQRLADDINPIAATVLADARACGEHDAIVSETVSKELALEAAEERIQRQVIAALERLERGTFGICESCGGAIAPERLEAMPYAPLCVGCEYIHEGRMAGAMRS